MGTITASKRQLAWVFDLNKCIGCQTCSVACKVLWPAEDPGTEQQWWMTVNTQPGLGTPRAWEDMGGGFDEKGKLKLGRLATDERTTRLQAAFDDAFDDALRDVDLQALFDSRCVAGDPRLRRFYDAVVYPPAGP